MIRRNKARDQHAGMTLIELLVVVGILGLLSVIVLPAISGNEENRFTRAATEQVSSLISQARNNAVATGQWAGVTIRPVGTSSAAAIDIFRCRVAPSYRGDIAPASLQFTLSTKMMSVAAATPGCINAIAAAGVARYDLVQFDGRGPTYEIASVPDSSGFKIALRNADASENAGQTLDNTPWPPESIPMTFAIDRQPRAVGSPVTLGQSRCIDMGWSGFGPSSAFTPFSTGSTVSVVFDDKGQARKVFVGAARVSVSGPVFLLVGRIDRAGAAYNAGGGASAADDSVGANWQYPTSYWIAVDAGSGQVRTAECNPGATTPEESRQLARTALVSQGL